MTRRFSKWLQALLACLLLFYPVAALADVPDHLTESEHRVLQKLTEQSGTIQITWDEKRGTPRFISGKLSKPLKGTPYDMSLAFLDSIKPLYQVDRVKKSFRLKRVDQDELGMKHVRLSHLANGIPVWGDELVVHIDKHNVVRSINGQFTPGIEKNSERIQMPSIDAASAVKSALDDVRVSQPSATPTAMLYYFPYPDPETITLTYVVNIRDDSKPADWKVFVDALTGDVVHKYNDIKFKRSHGEVKKLEPSKK